jgi:acetate kinase
MTVLTFNCGSSTLKFDLLDQQEGGALRSLASGTVDRVGRDASVSLTIDGAKQERNVPAIDHAAAFRVAINLLHEAGLLGNTEAVGHRVVHGGSRFRAAALIDDDVVAAIEEVSVLAPLHNRPALDVIKAARGHFGALPNIAAFDTAFFAALPEVAALYAIPRELSSRLGIRRFGFHGLAHRYMVDRYSVAHPGVAQPRLITLQLGNGCSAAASMDGRPLDTSMGFTPLEGLIMGTRSGDIDPSIPLFLQTSAGMTPEEVDSLLNSRSGLLGLSGRSSDMRDLVQGASEGDAASALAIEAFCKRLQKYIGAYMAVLQGADAIIFGGGIGEHGAEIRRQVCEAFAWTGLRLNDEQETQDSAEVKISHPQSTIEVWVVRVDEAAVIAQEVMALLAVERTDP